MEGLLSEAEEHVVVIKSDPTMGDMEDLDSSEPTADRPPLLALTGSAQNTVRAESASRAARLRGPSVPVRMSPEFGSDGRQLATREERGAPSGVSAGPQGLVLTAEAFPLNPWLALPK